MLSGWFTRFTASSRPIPGLKEGVKGVLPEYDKCIEMATEGALKELVPAGIFAIMMTIGGLHGWSLRDW